MGARSHGTLPEPARARTFSQDDVMPRALITGPTSGIGQGFAEALAKQGHDLILVSRDRDRLEETARDLAARFSVDVEVLPADLSERADIDRIATIAASQEIDVLVNNAGFGIKGGFLSSSVEEEQRMMDVLMLAVMRLTRAVLPGMVDRGRGYVFTVSSVAGWITGGTYSAAKAWATVFTEGLVNDLAGTGVRAVAVCPGFTHTEFHQRAGMSMSAVSEWMWLDVEDVVTTALRDARAGRVVSVAGPQYKALSVVLRVLPRPLVRWVGGSRQASARFARSKDRD